MASHWMSGLIVGCCALAAAQAQPASPRPTPPPPQASQLQPAASEIVFITRQMGVPVEGRFTRFSAQLALQPASPEGGSVNLTIDTGSARFGSPELDAEVPKAVWFDAARFPQASFQSSSIKVAGASRLDVTGRLTIKGRALDIGVPVQLQPAAGGQTQASGTFTIKRLDFAIGTGEWKDTALLADDVQVRFRLVFSGLVRP